MKTAPEASSDSSRLSISDWLYGPVVVHDTFFAPEERGRPEQRALLSFLKKKERKKERKKDRGFFLSVEN